MSNNSFKVKNSVVLTPKNLSTLTSPEAGELACDINDANKIKRYNADSASWVEVGSGGGGINYIENDDFEAGTTGWSIYEDAPGDAPVDGTGIISAPNLSLSVSTSLPLRGLKSAFINKASGGASRGNGLSCNFTIDKADQAQVLRVSFDYSADSGYSDGNFRVYVYDVTNAQLIEVIDRDVLASSQGKYVGTFQTSSNSTSYRLCIHSTDTSTSSSYSFQLDNVVVGPQSIVKGPIVTDWEAYTPTILGLGTGSTSALSSWYRRVGDNLELKGTLIKDASNGSGGATVTVSLPTGLTYDSTKIKDGSTSEFSALGTYRIRLGGTGTNQTETVYMGSSGTLAFREFGAVGTNVSGADMTANTQLSWTASVPILGWSSNVVLSEDAGNREIVFNTGSGLTPTSSINTSTFTKVTFSTSLAVLDDTTASYNASLSRYVIPETGYYDLAAWAEATITGGSSYSGGGLGFLLYVDGTDAAGIDYGMADQNVLSSTNRVGAKTWNNIKLNKGQYVELFVRGALGSGGTAINYSSGSGNGTGFSIAKRSSPQTVAASEVVATRCNSSAGQVIPNGTTTILKFENKFFDTHNSYNVTTGEWTCPQTGYYKVDAQLTFTATATWATGEDILFDLFVNSSSVGRKISQPFTAAVSVYFGAEVSRTVYLLKGDIVTLRVSQTSGASLAVGGSGDQNFSIIKINGVS